MILNSYTYQDFKDLQDDQDGSKAKLSTEILAILQILKILIRDWFFLEHYLNLSELRCVYNLTVAIMLSHEDRNDGVTYQIIGCAMRIHNTLGNGFQEVIYQRCLNLELKAEGLSFEREKETSIFYNGTHVGTRRADFIVADRIVVELKAVIRLEDAHLAQAKNYVVAYNFPKGLLINFGARSLEYKLVFNNRYGSGFSGFAG